MTFTRTTTLAATVAAAIALAACGHSKSGAEGGTRTGSFTIRDGQVVISSKGVPEARVSPEGRLTIDGQEVTVTEGQRAQLVNYFNAANGVVNQAAATGVAGAQVGVAAAGGAASGLAKGDMSELKAKVEAQANEVRRQAMKICQNLADVRAAQDALAAQVDAFKPYAVVSARETADCAKDLQKGPGG